MAQPPPYDPNYPPPQQDPNYPPQDPNEKPGYPPQGYPPQQQQPYPPQQQPYPSQQPYPAAGPPPPAQQQQTTNTVVVTGQPQPVVVTNVTFRDYPVTMTNSKGQTITTRLEYRSGVLTWIVCAVMCFFLWGLGLCFLGLIPFCVDSLKDVEHIDPTDGTVVGVYKRI